MSQRTLEATFRNERHHMAFMTGQIRCGKGAGQIVAELRDLKGDKRLELAAGAESAETPHSGRYCLTMPVPPGWAVECYRVELEPGIATTWAEVD